METTAFVPPSWPQSMEDGRVPDAAFASAYARVPDRQRAWIKTGIASVFAACGGPMPSYAREDTGLGHDLHLGREDSPLDYAVVVCGPDFFSPARLVAAVIPALCARVAEVAVVRVGARWPHVLLTALELCGVETACRVGVRAMSGVYEVLAAKGEGAVVLLDAAPLPKAVTTPGMRLYPARFSGRLGLVDGDRLDTEALAFAHPEATFFVHGAREQLDHPFVPAAMDLDAGAQLDYAAVYGDVARLRAAAPSVPLVLGPGRETFWMWPTLPARAFRRQRLIAAVDNRAGSLG